MLFSKYISVTALLSLLPAGVFAAPSLTEVLASTANLTQFNKLLTGQYKETLHALQSFEEPITILAPSDNAFQRLVYQPSLQTIFAQNETARIANLLAYHSLPGTWTSQTLNGTFKFIPTMTSSTNFSLVTGGQRVGAVLQGGQPHLIVFVSASSTRSVVLQSDIPFAGGTIQVLDNFLVPPTPFVDTVETYGLANEPQAMTSFLGAIYSNPNSTLPSLLNTTSDITVFVPVNIGMEIVSNALTTADPSALLSILEYHIYLGGATLTTSTGNSTNATDSNTTTITTPTLPIPLYSSNFAPNLTLPMLNGQTALLTFLDNAYFLNSARLLTTDILLSNGVIHMIDNVLNPAATTASPNPTSATQIPVLPTIGTADGFNSSHAPFTTDLPNYVNTAKPTTTRSSVVTTGQGGSTTETSAAASSSLSSGKKSGAGRTGEEVWAGTVGSWVLSGMVGVVGAMVCFW